MNKYFFLDEEHIEFREGLERVFHQPCKQGEPVISPETVFERGRVCLFNSPIFCEREKVIRLWYIGSKDLLPLYAESEDGLNWVRPRLNLVKRKGNYDNNIIDLGLNSSRRKFSRIVLANNPESGVPGRKYCGLLLSDWKGMVGNLQPVFSEDGFRWKMVSDHQGLPSDDEYRLGCDMENGLLIATVKLYGYKGMASFSVPEHGRSVGIFTSSDGLKWNDLNSNYCADFEDREAGKKAISAHLADLDYRSPIYIDPRYFWSDIYNMPVFHYHGIYIGLPVMFHHSGYWPYPNQDGLLWPALTWSRDLLNWKRPSVRKPFIPLSSCNNTSIFDNGGIHACSPIRMNNELWFYYTGARCSHVSRKLLEKSGLDYTKEKDQNAIFLAKLRVDGFASLRTGENKGALLTKSIPVEGSKLHVNARCANGEIKAEIRDAETGRVLPGFGIGDYLESRSVVFSDGLEQARLAGIGARHFDDQVSNDSTPFSGDEVDAVMRWRRKKNLSQFKGRKVRIMFAMKNAEIYSFWFSE